jgi:phosphoribosylanthranilate isomerase
VPVEVKICGLTRPADASAAVAAGADWLGVVFASGPRLVTAGQARKIASAAGRCPVLGVFGSHPADQIVALCRDAGLAGAQLHGDYTARQAAEIRGAGLVVWRVVRATTAADLVELRDRWDVDGTLVEPRAAQVDGGSGVRLDAELARAARRALAGRRMILAGGLTADTVAAAVGLVAPDVVDVSSGVESRPGIKDPSQIGRFVEAARGHRAVV